MSLRDDTPIKIPDHALTTILTANEIMRHIESVAVIMVHHPALGYVQVDKECIRTKLYPLHQGYHPFVVTYFTDDTVGLVIIFCNV